jgi:trans-aconitate methyltransferase
MKENGNLRETYNKIAESWDKDHEKDTWWIEGANDFLALLPKDARILDIGCASGPKTNYMKQKGFQVEGIDFSENMIKNAKERFPDIDFNVLDVYNLEKLNKTYDGIFSQAVLLHIPKERIVEVLEKMKSKLNKDGLLYVAVKGIKDNGIEEEIKKENDYGFEYERFFSYFNQEELKNYFSKIGLEVIYEKIVDSGPGRSKWINIIGKNSK